MRRSALIIFSISLVIAALGILSIYSSNYQREGEFWQSIYQRQMLWVAIGLVLFFIMSNFNYRRLWDLTHPLYGIVVFLLLLVFISGITRLGAQRWLRIAWFNLQPSEVAKLMIVIFMAKYFSDKSVRDISLSVGRFGIIRALVLPIAYLAVPVLLIIEQPDLGSGILVIAVFFVILLLAGVKLRYLALLFVLAAVAVPVFWNFLRDYQKDRLMVFLNPNIDPLGAGYTVIQSRIAVGSGGLFGKGWLFGTQNQLHFLPESHTDFIFATFAEEWGFIGGMALLVLYYLLIRQGIGIAQRTSDSFARLLAFGISFMLGIQVCVNIAMNLGFAPVVGIPLPLMSYGGSSILTTFISLGILVNIAKKKAVF